VAEVVTGLSFDGKPVNPVLLPDGRWVSPVTGAEVVRLRTGLWTHKPSQRFLDVFGVTLEQHLEDVARDV
jgi:hypothetical protein